MELDVQEGACEERRQVSVCRTRKGGSREAGRCHVGCHRDSVRTNRGGGGMLSITQSGVWTGRSCVCCPLTASPCSHSGFTFRNGKKTEKLTRFISSHPALEMMYDCNAQWGMAHLFWLICSSCYSKVVFIHTYIHIQYRHTSGVSSFLKKGEKS